MYKIGFCYPLGQDPVVLRDDLVRLQQFGYDGVEFWEQMLRRVEIAHVADALVDANLACAQLCPYFNFVDGQELWDHSMRLAEEYLTWAEQLPGQPLIRVFTGKPWGQGVVGPAEATPAQWEAAIAGLQRICDMAAPRGIRLALECHTGSLMEDAPSALRLLQGVDRPNLGTNLQLPLADGRESVEISLRELGRFTIHMHAHNYTTFLNGIQVPLGEGVLDYHAILTTLLRDGFCGYVSIEHADYGGTRDPWVVAEHEGRFLQALRRRLEQETCVQ